MSNSRRTSLRSLSIVSSLALVAFGAVCVFPTVVDAAPAIEIEAVATSTTTMWLEDRTFGLTVTNPGTEPLVGVLVSGGDGVLVNEDFGDIIDGPTYVSGNSDDVLDPGEVWSYSATAPTVPGWQYDVKATDPAGDVVAATAGLDVGNFPDALPFPIAIDVVADSDVVTPGTTLGFTVAVTNTSTVTLDLDGEHRLLPPVRDGVVPNESLGEPFGTGDGDSVLDPDEKWEWRVQHVVVESNWYLALQFGIARAGFVPGYGVFFDGPPITVEASTNTTTTTPVDTQPPATTPATTAPVPSGQLPETGSSSPSTAWFAALLTIGGGLLVLASRRRTEPPSC